MFAIGLPTSGHYAIGAIAAITDIQISRDFCRVDAGASALVGQLFATGAILPSFTLIEGDGDTNNSSFSISNSQLYCISPAALGVGTYTVRILAESGAASSHEEALVIQVRAAASGRILSHGGKIAISSTGPVIQEVIQ